MIRIVWQSEAPRWHDAEANIIERTDSGGTVASAPLETVNRFCEEVINARDPAAAEGLVADDFVELDPLPGQTAGREGLQRWLAGWFAAFPDLSWTNEEQIAVEEKLVTRFFWTGTHQQEFMGIPATNKAVRVNGVVIDRVVDGLMVDSRMLMNALSMLQQLGAIPA